MAAEPVAQLEAILTETGQPVNPLRHNQITAYTEEAKRLGGVIEQRDADGRPGQSWINADPGPARRRLREIDGILVAQAPKRITGPRANTVHALATRLIEDVLKPAMLPRAVMRRNPAGAVGAFQRQEGSRLFKRAALAVKRAIMAVDPENPDPDRTNLERFRREGTGANGTSTFMSDATIPGYHAMTPQAKQNWPEGFAEPQHTALAQVQQREARERPARPRHTKTLREKRPASPAVLAHMAKLNAARRAKSAAAQGTGSPQPAAKG